MLHGLRPACSSRTCCCWRSRCHVIGGALVLILNTRDAPPEPTYQQLATLALNVKSVDVLNTTGFNLIFPTRARSQQPDQRALADRQGPAGADHAGRCRRSDRALRQRRSLSAEQPLNGQIERYIIPAAITRNVFAGIRRDTRLIRRSRTAKSGCSSASQACASARTPTPCCLPIRAQRSPSGRRFRSSARSCSRCWCRRRWSVWCSRCCWPC